MVDKIEVRLKYAITAFVVPLQTSREINRGAFDELHDAAKSICRMLKGTSMVSKALLNELYVTALVIRAEKDFFPEEASLLEEMSHKIELCFSLILKNEAPEDRQPGVPKII